MEKISLIIPAYNEGNYIEKCLKSIISQTYQNLEIIIVNDGSTDNTLEVVNSFAKRDDRIRVFSKNNGGVSSARNFGLDQSTGNLIGFVDPDDFIDEQIYQKLQSLLSQYDADIACCHLRGCTSRDYQEPTRTPIIKNFNHFEALDKFLSPLYSFNGLKL